MHEIETIDYSRLCKKIPVNCGYEGPKFFAEFNVFGETLPLFVKQVSDQQEARRQIMVASQLEANEIAVPIFRRLIEYEGRYYVAFSDLREHDRFLIWSTSDPRDELDQFNLSKNDVNLIYSMIVAIHQKAKGKFSIRSDAYFLRQLRAEPRTTDIVLADLGRVYAKSIPPHYFIDDYKKNGLEYAKNFFISELLARVK